MTHQRPCISADHLPLPAIYTPWTRGVYEVSPGLKPLGTDFGNGARDGKLFQFDRHFVRYRENKLRCLEERPEKYRVRHELSPRVERAATEAIATHLTEEWPDLFVREGGGLFCALTQETVPTELDALALQLPEDLAIVQMDGERDWNAYLNLCSPSHWAATDKIGKSFFETHRPIPGFERVNAVAGALVESVVKRGPFVRFVWGLESDDRLNHHPEPPPGEDADEWQGRHFDRRWCVRFERQCLRGLPDADAALFVIHVGFVSQAHVKSSPGLMESLVAAVRSMSPEAQVYKGVRGFLEAVDAS